MPNNNTVRSTSEKLRAYYDRDPIPSEVLFWRKVDKEASPTGCWIWKGQIHPTGYGSFVAGIRGSYKTHWAHRFAYQLAVGEIPQGNCVLHSCDTPLCVNPDHLFIGTHLDNSRDMAEKERHPHIKRRTYKGSRPGKAKLTEAQARAIKVCYETGNTSYKALGKIFGVTDQAICRICSGKNWSHLNEE